MVTKIVFKKEFVTFFSSLFVLNLLYSFLLCRINQTYSSLLTVPFLLLLFLFFIWAFQLSSLPRKQSSILYFILFCGLTIHLSIIFGVFLAAPTIPVLWVPDSLSLHVPGVQKVMDFVDGHNIKDKTSIYDRTYLTYLLVMPFFKLLGTNHIASALALIIPKLITLLIIFKITLRIDSEKTAQFAALVYCFLPTQIFYSLVFYKEAVVQMLVALLIFNLFLLNQKLSWKLIPTLLSFAFALLALGNERHYLLPCYVVSLFSLTFLSQRISIFLRALILIVCFTCYKVFLYYYTDINYDSITATVLAYRDIFLSYPDVSPINKWLPYPLGVIKLFFSPYFTIEKFKTYSYFAGLLTFGSFFYQFIAVSFLVGIYQKIKEKKQLRILIVQMIPFIIFLAIFGYVAPYEGRARDSFLPLIVIYSSGFIANSFYFNTLLRKLTSIRKWVVLNTPSL